MHLIRALSTGATYITYRNLQSLVVNFFKQVVSRFLSDEFGSSKLNVMLTIVVTLRFIVILLVKFDSQDQPSS